MTDNNAGKRIDRRNAIKWGAASLLATSFLQHASAINAARGTATDKLAQWKADLAKACTQLGNRKISGLQWQELMDKVYGATPMDDLLAMVNFDAIRDSIITQDIGDRGENFVDIPVPDVADAASKPEPSQILISKIAYIKKGRHIPPHGHSNMVSAFLCIAGDFSVRQFDHIESNDEQMVVRETINERHAGVGTWSSISDYRNNVHWLTANSENCFLFTCKLIRLEEAREFNGRINIDMRSPEVIGTNTYRARKITSAEARELY